MHLLQVRGRLCKCSEQYLAELYLMTWTYSFFSPVFTYGLITYFIPYVGVGMQKAKYAIRVRHLGREVWAGTRDLFAVLYRSPSNDVLLG